MKTIASCDDVFEILTAGPFPSGDNSNPAVHEHLAACVACKELAEALRPACNLLHESLSDAERQTLPMFHDSEEEAFIESLNADLSEILLPLAMPAPSGEIQLRTSRSWSNRILGGLCVAFLLLLLASGSTPWSGKSSATTTSWEQLNSMQMSPHCVRDERHATAGSTVVNSPAATQYLCCTNCHNNTPKGRHATSATSLLASCGACHN